MAGLHPNLSQQRNSMQLVLDQRWSVIFIIFATWRHYHHSIYTVYYAATAKLKCL